MGRPGRKTGEFFRCQICNDEFYRTPGQIKGGSTKTCSKACLSIFHTGKGNPFWGRTHSEETKQKVSKSRKGKCIGNKNAKGFRHTEAARKKISEASKKMWANPDIRKKVLDALPRGTNHKFHKSPELHRHRKHFTPRQKREWKGDECFYCKELDDLVLDHIIPIFNGGINMRENCQTLCRACNLWKVYHVDLPRYYAALANKGADIDPL